MARFSDLIRYELIKKKRHASLQTHIARVLEAYGINLVIDVGAHWGQFGAELRKLGYKGAIHSFEPVAKSFARLSAAAAGDGLWRVHNMGLGAQAGAATINVLKHSNFSSVLAPSAFGAGRFAQAMETEYREQIRIGTVDLFMEEHFAGADVRALLKMDTQGFDLPVFRGSAGSRDKICCLLSELSLIPIYDAMPGFTETLEAYGQGGFAISGLYPVTRNPDLSVIEMDCMLVAPGRFRPAAPA